MTLDFAHLPRRLTPLLLALMLSACASPDARPPPTPAGRPPPASPIAAWPLAELAANPHSRVLLRTNEQPVGVLPTSFLRAAWAAGQRLVEAGHGLKPELLIADGGAANAFAFYQEGSPRIAANLAMVELLGDDEAAWAALIGHELAHLNLRHQDVREQRQTSEQAASELLGIVLTLVGVPFGSTLADTATALAERSYSRDDEREADRTAVKYMLAAGYDLEGAVRLQERLAAAGGGRPLSFLSTHPSGSERVEAMRALVRELGAQAK